MEIINWFKGNYPDLVKKMKKCNHEIDDKTFSPYHAEGDVWTHTLMVYNQVKRSSLELKLAALLHDIGKPDTVHRKNDNRPYYSFTGHEQLSTIMAVDILKKFESDFNKYINKEIILKAINYHQDIHKIGKVINNEYILKEEEKIFLNKKFGDLELYSLMIGLSEADANGRFCEDMEKLDKQYQHLWNFIPNEYYKGDLENRPEFIMLAGIQGSGKSTLAKELMSFKEFVYLSNDDILMEKNTKKVPYGMFWSIERRDEAIKELYIRLEKAIKERKNIIIDNVNIDELARTRQLNMVPDKYYHKIAINVITDIKTIFERNKERKKEMRDIPVAVIENYMRNYSFIGEDQVHTSKVYIS
jgi:predicted kinase